MPRQRLSGNFISPAEVVDVMVKRLTLLERTAFHEAGHAVAAFFNRRRFIKISIVPDDNDMSMGRVIYPSNYWKGLTPHKFAPRTRAHIEEEVLKIFAGEVAEAMACRRLGTMAREHLKQARVLASYVCTSPGEGEAFIQWLWKREINLMKEPSHWLAVQTLADMLIEKKEIGYGEARQIICEAICRHKKLMETGLHQQSPPALHLTRHSYQSP